MMLHKTGHGIADEVSDRVGELPDGPYRAAYGILRGSTEWLRAVDNWFEIDKGMWGASHYYGNYRLSFRGTQPLYRDDAPVEPHGLTLEPWRDSGDHTMICPPTQPVCAFFGIDYTEWLMDAVRRAGPSYAIRHKGMAEPIDWPRVRRVITFNSTVGVEALRRGILVISDPDHSSIGSWGVDGYDREPLFCFLQAHQFKLAEKSKICSLISHYMSTSVSTAGKL